MRGMGQIAELCEIAEPNVGAITNVGPVHLELLGTLEAIAEAKAGDPRRAGRARAWRSSPSTPRRSSRTSHDELRRSPSGPAATSSRTSSRVEAVTEALGSGRRHGESDFRFPFTEAHNLSNALAAIAIGVALEARRPRWRSGRRG